MSAPRAGRRVRAARGRAAPPGVGGRRHHPARAPRDRRRSRGCSASRFPEAVGGSGGTLLDSVDLQEAMFEAGASSGLMAGLFTSGIALPHIAASGDADLDRPLRPPDARRRRRSARSRSPSPGGGSDVAGITTTAVRDGDALRRQRRQDLHHLRRPRRLRDHRRPHRRARATPASRCSSSRPARPASPSTGRCARWAGTARTPPSCRTSTCASPSTNLVGAGERRLLPDRRAVRGRADRASPCTPTASRPARSTSPRRTAGSARRSASR